MRQHILDNSDVCGIVEPIDSQSQTQTYILICVIFCLSSRSDLDFRAMKSRGFRGRGFRGFRGRGFRGRGFREPIKVASFQVSFNK